MCRDMWIFSQGIFLGTGGLLKICSSSPPLFDLSQRRTASILYVSGGWCYPTDNQSCVARYPRCLISNDIHMYYSLLYMHTHTYIYMYIYIYMLIYHIHVNINIYIHMRRCIRTYLPTYITLHLHWHLHHMHAL